GALALRALLVRVTSRPPHATPFPFTTLFRSIRPAPSSGEFALLTLLSRAIVQTLQRFYMTVALILDHPQYGLDAEELESLCTVIDRKSTRLNSSHVKISYAVFCLKKKQSIRP